MKKKSLLVLATSFVLHTGLISQIHQNKVAASPDAAFSESKSDFIKNQTYFSVNTLKDYSSYYGDSLNGFDEEAVKTELLSIGLYGSEFSGHVKKMKRQFIDKKYALKHIEPSISYSPSNGKLIGSSNQVNVAPCVNEGFELTSPGAYTNSNSVMGWTVSSRNADALCTPTNWVAGSTEFSVISTPILGLPFIGTLGNSPLGGFNIVQLNDFTPDYNCTRLSQTFPVTNSNSLFKFAFAGLYQDGGSSHSCCSAGGFSVVVKDCSGNILPCYSLDLQLNSSSVCATAYTTYTYSSAYFYTNWQLKSIDLSAFINTCVTIEVMTFDCGYGGHYGTTFFDAECASASLPGWCTSCSSFAPLNTVNYCIGSNIATIQGPQSFSSYTWTSPSNGSTVSASSSLTISNPVTSSVYTLQASNGQSCTSTFVYTLVPTSVAINALGSSPSCSVGSQGSASVQPTGSSTGYLYTWLNSGNTVVSTASVASNLSLGIYTVIITGNPATGCGTAVATTTVGLKQPGVTNLIQPFCGNTAYLTASTGTNYQWYNGISPVSAASGGTASSLTVSNASNNTVYHVRYSNGGCVDSLKFTLLLTPSGSISVLSDPFMCAGNSNGNSIFSIVPTQNSPGGLNSYTVISTNSSTPSYSVSSGPSSSNTISISNLSAYGNYSISVFDGACIYSSTFTKNTISPFNFTLNPGNSVTLCPGNAMLAGIILPNLSNSTDFTYSWSPTSFLFNNIGSYQQTVITPTFASGAVSTLIYTVVVTPTLANCPETRTMSLTMADPLPPMISGAPLLCTNSTPFTLSVNPAGGTFSGNSSLNTLSGIITPSMATIGTNSFTYAISVGTCVAKSNSSYIVNNPPVISVSGNTLLCNGQSTSLLANGPATFSWTGFTSGPVITVNPPSTTIYTVTGYNASTTCSNIHTLTVNVVPIPVMSITGNTLTCSGNSVNLTASGANTYLWNTGAIGANVSFTAVNSNSYSVIGTSSIGNCSNSASVFIIVNPSPDLQVSPNDSICLGETVILNASGANVYNWSNGSTSASISITPVSGANYTITGTNNPGNCTSTKVIRIEVSECTGLESLESGFGGLSVFPNPTNGNLILEIPGNLTFKMFNDLGKLIFEKQFEKGIHNIDMSRYSSGVYLVKIYDSSAIKVLKLLKTD